VTPLKASTQHEETTVRIITFKELKALKGIPFSREHLRRLEAAGKFPKRVRLAEGGDSYGYLEKEIDDYLTARAAARNDGRAA
jgi:prophage regulatory protein